MYSKYAGQRCFPRFQVAVSVGGPHSTSKFCNSVPGNGTSLSLFAWYTQRGSNCTADDGRELLHNRLYSQIGLRAKVLFPNSAHCSGVFAAAILQTTTPTHDPAYTSQKL